MRNTRSLRSGAQIPAIGVGTFGSDHVSHEEVARAVATALELGYRLVDCASVYGNEAEIGTVLATSDVARDELFVMSKVWNDAHAPADVRRSCEGSLRDLRLDYLDAYFVHWPFRNYHAPFAAPDARNPDSHPFVLDEFLETWGTLEALHDEGLIRALGMSNMTTAKLDAILPAIRIQPSLIEMELHPAFQQPELFDYVVAHDIQPIGYSPLGSPARPERDRDASDVAALELPIIRELAEARGVHPATIALRWAVQRGQIPIPLSTNPRNLAANLAVLEMAPLSDEEMAAIAAADANCRLIKGQVFLWPGADDWRLLWDEV